MSQLRQRQLEHSVGRRRRGRPVPRQLTLTPEESAALLDALFSEGPVGLGYFDASLRHRRVNARLAAINGVPAAEHEGRRPSELIGELGLRVEALVSAVLATGEAVHDLEVVGETPSHPGVKRQWLASYLPVGETPVGVAAMVVEITRERDAARRAAVADAELRALYSASPVGVGILDTDLRYMRVNDTLARMNGRPAPEHVGCTIEEVLGAPAAELRPALEQVMATREPLELEATVHERAFSATYFPILGDDGELRGVGAVVADVTHRHTAEVEQSRLLREALLARAQAEAAQVRAQSARADAERGHERIAFLAQAGREMAAALDWEETLRNVVRIAVPRVADSCALTVREPSGRLRVVAVAHRDPDRAPGDWEEAERERTAAVVASGEPYIGEHLAIAPLAGGLGALSCHLADSSERAFNADDADLITSIAARAGLHIQNARLFAERTHIARTLQAGLRPRALPDIDGAELAAHFLPSGDENVVGGDFYDVFRSDEDEWTVMVGDVSGKGPEAAAVTALARHTLRTASLLQDDPAQNLALLNRVLFAEPGSAFCTVFHARVRPAASGLRVWFSNGGHPQPMVLRADGTVEALHGGAGQLVGALEEARFGLGTLELAPGETLLLYTDGVTEIRSGDLGLGERELRATLAATAGAPADAVVAAAAGRALELHAGRPRDDIALVALRACPV